MYRNKEEWKEKKQLRGEKERQEKYYALSKIKVRERETQRLNDWEEKMEMKKVMKDGRAEDKYLLGWEKDKEKIDCHRK